MLGRKAGGMNKPIAIPEKIEIGKIHGGAYCRDSWFDVGCQIGLLIIDCRLGLVN